MSETTESSPSRQSLDAEIAHCIDRGLECCGPSVKNTTFWQLLVVFNLKPREIPESIERFAAALEKIFGSGGAIMVEREIAKELAAHFHIQEPRSMRVIALVKQVREIAHYAEIEAPLEENHFALSKIKVEKQ